MSLHTLGVLCGLAAGAWLGMAEAPTKLVTIGFSPFLVSLGMVAGVFVARWTVPMLLKGTNYIWADLAEKPYLIAWAILAGMLWAVANTLTVFAILGTMLGVGGFVAQVATVSSMVGAGADLVRAASLHITVALFCLVATFVFEMMAIRMKETGFHSVVAVACSFVGVFCARLVFYTLQAA